MKRLFVILTAFTISLATQAQDKDKYKGLKKISPDRPDRTTTIIHLDGDEFDLDLDDLDINIDLSSLESLSELSSLSELGSLSSLAELEKLEELESLSELEVLEELADSEFLEEIIEISIDASLKSLEALKELDLKPKRAEQ